jgi:hypothetical protein
LGDRSDYIKEITAREDETEREREREREGGEERELYDLNCVSCCNNYTAKRNVCKLYTSELWNR